MFHIRPHHMALIMIMVLALLVYALAERKLRLQLAETGETVLNQVGKPIQTPTMEFAKQTLKSSVSPNSMRWIFQVFEGIDLLIVSRNGQVVNRQVLNLKGASDRAQAAWAAGGKMLQSRILGCGMWDF